MLTSMLTDECGETANLTRVLSVLAPERWAKPDAIFASAGEKISSVEKSSIRACILHCRPQRAERGCAMVVFTPGEYEFLSLSEKIDVLSVTTRLTNDLLSLVNLDSVTALWIRISDNKGLSIPLSMYYGIL